MLIGSDAVEEEDVKEAVKLNTLILLHEKYGITERDFTRAEIEVVPAHKARDVGFDRSMVGGYGHDDRVDAYPALVAEIETKDPMHTTVCVLTDKEEIGSDGVTGMQSMYVFHFLQLLCRAAGQDDIIAFQNSVCLSADVTAAYDPSWAGAFEPKNGTYAGRGVAFFKYTGSRGKSSASDANAELVGDITRLLDANNVAWLYLPALYVYLHPHLSGRSGKKGGVETHLPHRQPPVPGQGRLISNRSFPASTAVSLLVSRSQLFFIPLTFLPKKHRNLLLVC